MGRNTIRNLTELGALAALVNRRNADAVAHTYRVPVVSLEEPIADPGIQAIVIATRPCITRGWRHVYVEMAIALASESVRLRFLEISL